MPFCHKCYLSWPSLTSLNSFIEGVLEVQLLSCGNSLLIYQYFFSPLINSTQKLEVQVYLFLRYFRRKIQIISVSFSICKRERKVIMYFFWEVVIPIRAEANLVCFYPFSCVRFSWTSLSFKPEPKLSKKNYLSSLIKKSFSLLVEAFL